MSRVFLCKCGCKFIILDSPEYRYRYTCPYCMIRKAKPLDMPPIIRRKILDVVRIDLKVSDQVKETIEYLERHTQ